MEQMKIIERTEEKLGTDITQESSGPEVLHPKGLSIKWMERWSTDINFRIYQAN
jgi:hypothetical protein